MLPLIFSGIAFVLWALLIITVFYSTYYSGVDHINVEYIKPLIGSTETFFASGFGKYIVSVIIVYGIYKFLTAVFSREKERKFGIPSILGFFFLHLFIITTVYASITEGKQMVLQLGGSSALVLFFHIISLLFYPVVLTLIMRASWYTLLTILVQNWSLRDKRITILAETSIGFAIFSTLMLVLGTLGWYTLIGLIIVLLGMSILGWKWWRDTYDLIKNTQVVFDNHQSGKWLEKSLAPRLLTAEFSFFILTLMIGVAMISIIRPMPIGWDDLGVYMNYPKIMALTGESLPGAGMYSWQLITGTGFLFSYTAAQAFFINQFGSILAIIAIGLALSVLFERKNTKSWLALPLIFATVYYVMPMTVFHHTKDMKLDPALLFFSISAFMVFFTEVKSSLLKNKKEFFQIIVLTGVLIGFAFSVKVTTLMLILGVFWVLAYRLLSFWGYMGFFFLFLSIFTGANLWSVMNVWMPSDAGLLKTLAIILAAISSIAFVIAYLQKKENFKHYFIANIVLLISFFIGLSPWIVKNTSEVQPWNAVNIDAKSLLMSSVLGWSGAGFQPDFDKIMTKEEYQKRSDIIKNFNISSDGQSQNEDFGRYFGYDAWLNNYVRLPINLTFQKNQWGEFTSITYIFLALLPVLFLFARGRFPWVFRSLVSLWLIFVVAYAFMWPSEWGDGVQRYPIKWMLDSTYASIVENETYRETAKATQWTTGEEIGESIKIAGTYGNDMWNILIKKPIFSTLYSIKSGEYITNILALKWVSQYPLLFGYGILVLFNIIFIASIHFLTRADEEDENFRDMSVMLNVYGFLFLISAFGIVWYGILVYFIFFALMGLLARRFTDSDDTTESDDTLIIKWTLSALLFIFIALYFVRTAVPHAWTNLKSAGFNEYKYNLLNQEETLFTYRADYFVPIATMNLHDTSILTEIIPRLQNEKLRELLTSISGDTVDFLEAISQLIPQLQKSQTPANKQDGKILAEYAYNKVLYPSKEEAGTGGIYRIGTFMTYLINKNTQRYFDDSLIFGFEWYFYEENPEKTIEKMNTLGFKFLLIDLNAATIDKDPRHVLTQRYEHLLLTMRAKNLKLINTDNTCLQFALDEYKNGKYQSPEEFIDIAGTNYESYRMNGSGETITVGRGEKQRKCYTAMIDSMYNWDGATRYSYLASIKEVIDSNNAINDSVLLTRIMSSYAGQSFFTLFEIVETPETEAPPLTSEITIQ